MKSITFFGKYYAFAEMGLHAAPFLEKFAAIVKSKQGNSSGGPSGLQYKHIQHWKPDMVAEAY